MIAGTKLDALDTKATPETVYESEKIGAELHQMAIDTTLQLAHVHPFWNYEFSARNDAIDALALSLLAEVLEMVRCALVLLAAAAAHVPLSCSHVHPYACMIRRVPLSSKRRTQSVM